jgi:hypothetical protein
MSRRNLAGRAVLSGVLTIAASALVGTVGPAATAEEPDPIATVDATSAATYYRVTLASPVTVQAVVDAATENGLPVLSMRHAGATSGELVVGDKPLVEVAQMYVQTNRENFDVDPEVVSFVVALAPPLGLTVGGVNTTTTVQEYPSTDSDAPTPASEPPAGDVQAANIGHAWAPAFGSINGYGSSINNSGTRYMRHELTWDSRSGLDSYGTDYVYEHDTKLYDPDAKFYLAYTYPGGYTTPVCNTGHWAKGDTRVVSGNVPSSAVLYADNARASDDCGVYDVSFGIFYPGRLATNVQYTVVLAADSGPRSWSELGMYGQKTSNDCPGDTTSPWCVNINPVDKPAEDSLLLINRDRHWRLFGCHSWVRDGSPTTGTC